MRQHTRLTGDPGFTLIELMIVLALIAILVVIAGVTYKASLDRAKAVEVKTALYEVNRLENLYHQAHLEYSSDLTAIGYTLTQPLKGFKLDIQLKGAGSGVSYQATAKPTGSQSAESWVLTRYEDGTTVVEKVAPSAAGGMAGEGTPLGSGSSSDSIADTGSFAGKNRSSDGEVTNIVPVTKNTDPMTTGGSATSGGH